MSSPTGRRSTWLSFRKAIDSLFFFIRTHPRGTLIGAGCLLGLILMVQNVHSVRVKFFFWSFSFPMVFWSLFFGGMGYLAGKGIEWARNKQLARRKHRLSKGDPPPA